MISRTLVETRPSCPTCGTPAAPRFPGTGPHGFEVRCCENCQLGFTWPRLAPDELAGWYPPSYYGAGSLRFRGLLEKLVRHFALRRALRLVRRHRPGRVLDIGCGRGQTLAELRRAGWDVQGVELNENAAHFAREVLALPVDVSPFDGRQYPDQSFDAVVLWHVLEHLHDAPATLDEIGRILKPDGLLLVAVPNLASWQARVCGYGWFHLDLPRHVWHFTSSGLEAALARAGFDVIERSYASFEQNPFGWIQSLLNRAGLPHNLLYDLLRRGSARRLRSPLIERPAASIASLAGMAVLLPVALAMLLPEALLRKGATVELLARRRPTVDQAP